MYFKSKKTSLVILGVAALVCSRVLFALFNDPEGPNLLIVIVAAAVIFGVSLTIYTFKFKITALQRLLLAVLIQILFVAVAYFLLK